MRTYGCFSPAKEQEYEHNWNACSEVNTAFIRKLTTEARDIAVTAVVKSEFVKGATMNELFPYGYDVNTYIEKALEKMRLTYPWASKDMFRKEWSYAIEDVDGEYRYVSYFKWSDKDVEREVKDCTGEKFIENIIDDNRDWVEDANPVAEIFVIPLKGGIDAHGWILERYEFRTHALGGYSAWVQAGNRSTGGSRTFFIPPEYFEGSFNDFLDQYCELVPAWAFGLDEEYLKNTPGLKEFLGF